MRGAKRLFLLVIAFSLQLFSQGYICAVGGGGEGVNDWNREPYSWIVQKADSGTVLVLSVNDETTWIPDYFRSLGSRSSYNLKINSRTLANTQSIADSILAASAVFIKGGDQYNYINYWKGTLVESAIKQVYARGGVVAGTSAGAMVLGKFILSARYGSLYPDDALVNPFIQTSNIEDNFLGLVPEFIFDTHFIERGRQARLASVLLKLGLQGIQNVTGVGLDDRTAFCISPDGKGVVMGSGSVSFYRADSLTRLWSSGNLYELENLHARQLTKNWVYDLNSKDISFVPASAKAFNAASPSAPTGDVTLTGSNWVATSWLAALSAFVSRANTTDVLIISYPAYEAKANSILNELATYAPLAKLVLYTPGSETDTLVHQKIQGASAFIFAGDDLGAIKNITSPASVVGNLLRQKLINLRCPSFFFGEMSKLASTSFADNLNSDPYAAYRGKMTINEGFGVLPGFSIQPLTYANSDYYENRMAAVLWSVFKSQLPYGIYSNGNGITKFINADSSIVFSRFPFFLIDAREATLRDSSVYRASSSTGPRQVVALNSFRISASNNYGRGYSIAQKRFASADPTGVNPEENYGIRDNYEKVDLRVTAFPNPFTYSTKIVFESGRAGEMKLELFDIRGLLIRTLFCADVTAGQHSLSLQSGGLSSGIYFLRATFDDVIKTIKLVLHK